MKVIAALVSLQFFCLTATPTSFRIDPPVIVSGPKFKEVAVGSYVEFFCHANGKPIPKITWSFNGKPVLRKNSNNIILTDISLQISKVRETSHGEYCCQAKNGHRIQDQMCGSLFILKAPSVYVMPSKVSSTIGSVISLSCKKSGRPMPSSMWHYNGNPIHCDAERDEPLSCQIGNIHLIGDMLVIRNASLNNTGHYQCGVWNVVGQNLSESVFVLVNDVRNLKPFVSHEFFSPLEQTTNQELIGINNEFNGREYNGTFSVIFNVVGAAFVTLFLLVSLLHCWLKEDVAKINEISSKPTKRKTDFLSNENILPLEYPSSNLKFVKLIGKGKYGTVYKALAPSLVEQTTVVVAVKALHSLSESNWKILHNEAAILQSFNHSNIVSLLGVCFDDDKQKEHEDDQPCPPFLLFDFVDGNDLHSFLSNVQPSAILDNKVIHKVLEQLQVYTIDQKQCLLLFYLKLCLDISSAMNYLSLQGFVHRDLATRNCLLCTRSGIVKVGDFGLSRKLCDSDYYRSSGEEAMPLRWMAPESLLYGRYTTKSDVWSFAVTMWEIFSHSDQPHCGLENEEVVRNIVEGVLLSQPEEAPLWVYNLMKLCWSEPMDRPSFNAIYVLLSNALANCGKIVP